MSPSVAVDASRNSSLLPLLGFLWLLSRPCPFLRLDIQFSFLFGILVLARRLTESSSHSPWYLIDIIPFPPRGSILPRLNSPQTSSLFHLPGVAFPCNAVCFSFLFSRLRFLSGPFLFLRPGCSASRCKSETVLFPFLQVDPFPP